MCSPHHAPRAALRTPRQAAPRLPHRACQAALCCVFLRVAVWLARRPQRQSHGRREEWSSCLAAHLASARRCLCLTAAFGVNKQLAAELEKDSGAARFVLLEKPSRSKTSRKFESLRTNRVVCGASGTL